MALIRKIGLALFVLILILALALIALQVLLNPNNYKDLIQQRAAEQQVVLDLAGNIHWSLFPRPALVAEDIKLELPLADKRQAVQVSRVNVALDMEKALRGQLAFSSIEVNNASAVIDSNVDKIQKIENIDLKIKNLASEGSRFPVELSFLYTKDKLEIPVQLNAMISFDLLDNKVEKALIDDIGLHVGGNKIHGNVVWQQGSPAKTTAQLNSDAISLKELIFSNVSLSAVFEGKELKINELQAEAYQGSIKANGLLDVSGTGKSAWKINAVAKDVQFSSLLASLSNKKPDLSEGILQLDTRITMYPYNKSGALATMSGNLKFSIAAAVLDRDNLERLACEAAAQVSNKTLAAKNWSSKTQIRNIHGAAQIKSGIAWFSPLQIQMDTLNIVGSGPVDLINSNLDLPLDMKMLINPNAANACEVLNPRLADISWPLRCKGNYAIQQGKELCGIDQSRMAKVMLQAAGENLKGRLDGRDGKLKDVLKGLLN